MDMSIDADELTEAVAMPIAFHRLPVAAYTGAATITPCSTESMFTGHKETFGVHETCCAGRQYLITCMLPIKAIRTCLCQDVLEQKPLQHDAHEGMENAQFMHRCMPV